MTYSNCEFILNIERANIEWHNGLYLSNPVVFVGGFVIRAVAGDAFLSSVDAIIVMRPI